MHTHTHTLYIHTYTDIYTRTHKHTHRDMYVRVYGIHTCVCMPAFIILTLCIESTFDYIFTQGMYQVHNALFIHIFLCFTHRHASDDIMRPRVRAQGLWERRKANTVVFERWSIWKGRDMQPQTLPLLRGCPGMCMYVCMYVCMHVYMYTCACVYTSVCVNERHVYTATFTSQWICVCICAHAYVYSHACMCAWLAHANCVPCTCNCVSCTCVPAARRTHLCVYVSACKHLWHWLQVDALLPTYTHIWVGCITQNHKVAVQSVCICAYVYDHSIVTNPHMLMRNYAHVCVLWPIPTVHYTCYSNFHMPTYQRQIAGPYIHIQAHT